MGDEAIVGVAMHAGQVIDRISAVAGTAGGQFADIRFRLDHLGGAQVILHVQAGVVARNLLTPFLSEGGGTAAVRQHDHIALGGHQPVIPAIRPTLAQSSLRTSQEDFDGRILNAGIEFRREKHPGQHILSVHGIHVAFFGLIRSQLREDVLVLVCKLGEGSVGTDGHQFGGEFHAAIAGKQGPVFLDAEGRSEIEPGIFGGEAGDNPLRGDAENAFQPIYKGAEPDALAIGIPDRIFDIGVQLGGKMADIGDGERGLVFRSGGDRGHHQAHLVGFIAVPGHAQPGQLAAIGTPDRIGVVAGSTRNPTGLAGGDIIDKDIGIGREGVFLPGEFLARIGDARTVRTPGSLLQAAKRLHRKLEFAGILAQQVEGLVRGDEAVPGRCQVSLRQFLYPMVPVAIHQVFGYISLGFVQGRVEVGGMLDRAGNRADIEHLGVVGRQAEFADTGRYIGDFHRLAQFAGFERSFVNLAAAKIPDSLSVCAPAAVGNAFSAAGQLDLVRAVGLAEEEVAATAVIRDGGITDAIQDELAVGR